jgi:hypothetical protein
MAAIKIRRGGSPAVRERWGKKVQELTMDLGVVEIIEGKLGGGSLIRYRAGAVRFRGWRRCSGNWSAGRRRKIGQGASAWSCGADDALGEEGEEVGLWFD